MTIRTSETATPLDADAIEEPEDTIEEPEDPAEKTDTDGNGSSVLTDGCPIYTIDFTYNNRQYVLDGDGSAELSDILGAVGLTGNVTDAVSSAPDMFKVSNENGIWTVKALSAFSSSETLSVIIDGIKYTISVTDDGNGTGEASVSSGREGTEVTLTSTPNPGYFFKEWQVISGGVTITSDKFSIGTENIEIKAVFEKEITVGNDPKDGEEKKDIEESKSDKKNSVKNNDTPKIKDSSVKTGDSELITLFMVVMMISVMGVFEIMKKKRDREE